MGDGFQFLDIVLFAMLAAFVLLRLRSVLGRRTGHQGQRDGQRDGQRREPAQNPDAHHDDKVVTLPDRSREDEDFDSDSEIESAELWADDSPVGAGLTQIKIADHAFEPRQFLAGSRAAYEMIIEAFAKGDRDSLRNLLSDEVFGNFERAIDDREAAGQSLNSSIVAIRSADIIEASLNGRIAEVTVKFVSDMVSLTRDKDDQIIAGSPGEREVTDIWTFARDSRARDPNWALIATRSEN